MQNYFRIVKHEIMHALGAQHEHQRPSRNSFIIGTKLRGDPNFDIVNSGQGSSCFASGIYDYFSIMHYPLTDLATKVNEEAFKKCLREKLEMEPSKEQIDKQKAEIGTADLLSWGDLDYLKKAFAHIPLPDKQGWNDLKKKLDKYRR